MDAKDSSEKTALMHVAGNDIIDTPELKSCQRPSFARAMTDIVEELVEAGADVNMQDNIGETALIKATRIRRVQQTVIVKLLLAAGAIVNARDNNGKSPLMYANENSHTEIIELLVEAGAEE